MVVGPAGSGKSRLARELADRVRAAGGLVLSGGCAPGEGAPLAPFRQAVDDHLAAVARLAKPERDHELARVRAAAGSAASLLVGLSPALDAVLDAPGLPEFPRHQQFGAAVADLLAGLTTGARGALLHLDDVHWLSPTARRILARLVERLAEAPLLIVVSGRDDAASADAMAVVRDVVGERLELTVRLRPLTVAAVADLVSAATGGLQVDAPTAASLATRSGGNTFTLLQYLDAVLDAGLLRPHWGHWQLDTEDLHALRLSVDGVNVILDRLDQFEQFDRFDPESRYLLGLGAVYGPVFDHALVAAAAGLPPRRMLEVADVAAWYNLVERRDGGRYAFLHDRIREALVGQFDPDGLAAAHQRLADALDRLDPREPGGGLRPGPAPPRQCRRVPAQLPGRQSGRPGPDIRGLLGRRPAGAGRARPGRGVGLPGAGRAGGLGGRHQPRPAVPGRAGHRPAPGRPVRGRPRHRRAGPAALDRSGRAGLHPLPDRGGAGHRVADGTGGGGGRTGAGRARPRVGPYPGRPPAGRPRVARDGRAGPADRDRPRHRPRAKAGAAQAADPAVRERLLVLRPAAAPAAGGPVHDALQLSGGPARPRVGGGDDADGVRPRRHCHGPAPPVPPQHRPGLGERDPGRRPAGGGLRRLDRGVPAAQLRPRPGRDAASGARRTRLVPRGGPAERHDLHPALGRPAARRGRRRPAAGRPPPGPHHRDRPRRRGHRPVRVRHVDPRRPGRPARLAGPPGGGGRPAGQPRPHHPPVGAAAGLRRGSGADLRAPPAGRVRRGGRPVRRTADAAEDAHSRWAGAST